ncbi:MAG: hypothetical protein HC933_09455 [Pleurocapsa sp. SU_196_0]|nr:hypothetical protein [Pleurocapsa sp. SU_196_0]
MSASWQPPTGCSRAEVTQGVVTRRYVSYFGSSGFADFGRTREIRRVLKITVASKRCVQVRSRSSCTISFVRVTPALPGVLNTLGHRVTRSALPVTFRGKEDLMLPPSASEPRINHMQFCVDITRDSNFGARASARLVPTKFVHQFNDLRELGEYFIEMANWAEWQPLQPAALEDR